MINNLRPRAKFFAATLWRVCASGLAGLIAAAGLTGCTPVYDWRDVRIQETGWIATFPAKPVVVTRSLQPPGSVKSIHLTLLSARIENTLFAVGWADMASEEVRQSLEMAMLANLGQKFDQAARQTVTLGGLPAIETKARGITRLSQENTAEQAAQLIMRSLVTPTGVIEIIVIGPDQAFKEDLSRQFIESLRQP